MEGFSTTLKMMYLHRVEILSRLPLLNFELTSSDGQVSRQDIGDDYYRAVFIRRVINKPYTSFGKVCKFNICTVTKFHLLMLFVNCIM